MDDPDEVRDPDEETGDHRRDFLKTVTGALLTPTAAAAGIDAAAEATEGARQAGVGPEATRAGGREVVPGIVSRRPIPGEPYDLAGNRIVFTNWYYIRPGDLDRLDAQGKSVYVHGSEGPFAARYKGIDTPRGIRLVAQKPQRVGPRGRPSRIVQDGKLFRGRRGLLRVGSRAAVGAEGGPGERPRHLNCLHRSLGSPRGAVQVHLGR